MKSQNSLFAMSVHLVHDKWVPVTMAWRVLRLRMEERPPDILNKQLWTADKGWSSSLDVERGAKNYSP